MATSLGNVFSSSLQSAAAELPQSSAIQWKSSKATTTTAGAANPFSSFLSSGAAAPAATGTGTTQAKTQMMSAFSGMNLELNANGQVVLSSSSRELLHSKQSEKENEEAALQQQQQQSLKSQPKQPTVVTALSQAVGDFHTEVERSGRFISNNTRRQKGNDLSRRLRAKKNKQREKAEAYDERKSLKTRRDAKRQQRKERYKHVY